MPNAKGFDYYFGPLGANDDGVVSIHENNNPSVVIKEMSSLVKLYTEKSIQFLRQKNARPKQTFLVVFITYNDAYNN